MGGPGQNITGDVVYSVTDMELTDTPTNTAIGPVNLSSLRYDYGATSAAAAFVVTDGVDPDENDSYEATLTYNIDVFGSDNVHALTADIWPVETDLAGLTLELMLEVDVANSATDAFGTYGFFDLVMRNTDAYEFLPIHSVNLEAGPNLVSIDVGSFAQARALTFQLWGGPDQNITGDVIYTITDMELIAEDGDCLVGDVNGDGVVDLLDVVPFVDLLISGEFACEADIDGNGVVDLLDVTPFVAVLTGG